MSAIAEREINNAVSSPKNTAGLASVRVSPLSLLPCPPASSMATTSFFLITKTSLSCASEAIVAGYLIISIKHEKTVVIVSLAKERVRCDGEG